MAHKDLQQQEKQAPWTRKDRAVGGKTRERQVQMKAIEAGMK